MAEVTELLSVIPRDPRIRIIEISEYAALRDVDQSYVEKRVNVLSVALRK